MKPYKRNINKKESNKEISIQNISWYDEYDYDYFWYDEYPFIDYEYDEEYKWNNNSWLGINRKVDMESFYSKEMKRMKKIDSIIENEQDFKNTLGNILNNKIDSIQDIQKENWKVIRRENSWLVIDIFNHVKNYWLKCI